MGREDTDAVDSNDFLTITGETIIVNGVTTNTVTNQMMGEPQVGGTKRRQEKLKNKLFLYIFSIL